MTSEIGAATGLPLDLPPGRHPFDPYLMFLTQILGKSKTAAFLGVRYEPYESIDAVTVPALPEYL